MVPAFLCQDIEDNGWNNLPRVENYPYIGAQILIKPFQKSRRFHVGAFVFVRCYLESILVLCMKSAGI